MAQGQKSFYYLLGGIAVVGVVLVAARVLGGKSVSIPANVVVTTADTTGFRGYLIGSESAPVEVTEYADFQCPQCANFDAVSWPDIKERLIDAGKVRFRYRDFPLDNIHRNTRIGAHAAACADDQGKFWGMKSALYHRQPEWSESSSPMSTLKQAAKDAALDLAVWESCMESAKYAGRIQASADEAMKVGVNSTPTFLIGGRLYPGLAADEMVRLVDSLVALKAATPATAPTP
jgi:protein-disulfide isomerase